MRQAGKMPEVGKALSGLLLGNYNNVCFDTFLWRVHSGAAGSVAASQLLHLL